MSSLQNAMNSTARTANGAVTNYSSLNPCLDLFFLIGASRGKDITHVFERALVFDTDKTLHILLWARDVREGAGERQTFRTLLNYLSIVYPDLASKVLYSNKIQELGRWDDYLSTNNLHHAAAQQISNALGNQDALCAKWMPRKGALAAALRKHMNLSPKAYRKLLVNLSNTVEQKMCANQWETINYEHVPSTAAARYQKAFNRHDEERYKAYIDSLVKGEAKINAGAIYPHTIVKSVRHGDASVADAQWKALPNYMEGSEERIIPVVDVSGSMGTTISGNTQAIEVSIALGLYISERNTGLFKDEIITFSELPKLMELRGDSLSSRVRQLSNADWGYNTDIYRVFDTILTQAKKHNIPAWEMPTKVLILSDMEFDSCSSTDQTTFEVLRDLYRLSRYEMPQLVFWNLNSRTGNIPITVNDRGVALVSGFSPSILKSVLNGSLDPIKVMDDTVMKDRYKIL